MKKFNKKILLSVAILFTIGLLGSIVVFASGPDPIDLGTAGNFAILSKTGITNVPTSDITGDVGSSPITGASIGITCDEVDGTIYSTNTAGPSCRVISPTYLSTAVSDMEAAYTDAAGRTPGTGAFLNVGGGTVTTQTLPVGLYSWGTPVSITGDITLNGDATDVWIFQVSGTLSIDANKSIILSGGALPENVFWQVTETVDLMEGSHFEGNILTYTKVAMRSGATLTGRALAQTEVTLIANTITMPEEITPPATATLSIIKTIINDDEGVSEASDFSFSVNGGTAIAFESDGQNDITVETGTYNIVEIDVDGYSVSYSNCSDLVLASGESATCTITNDDNEVIPDDNDEDEDDSNDEENNDNDNDSGSDEENNDNDNDNDSGSSVIGGTIYGCKDPNAINYNYFSSSRPSLCKYTNSTSIVTTTTTTINESSIITTPKLPKTGFPSFESDSWYTVLFNKILNIIK